MKLNILPLAFSLGIVWGVGMLITGWISMHGWAVAFVHIMSSVYVGYDSSFIGGIIGGIWGFFDGAIGGLVFAFLYNLFRRKT